MTTSKTFLTTLHQPTLQTGGLKSNLWTTKVSNLLASSTLVVTTYTDGSLTINDFHVPVSVIQAAFLQNYENFASDLPMFSAGYVSTRQFEVGELLKIDAELLAPLRIQLPDLLALSCANSLFTAVVSSEFIKSLVEDLAILDYKLIGKPELQDDFLSFSVTFKSA
jgi:hypothetical protein